MKPSMAWLASAVALAAPIAAAAQPAPDPIAAPAETLDPARLEAAGKLLEATYPADRREAIIAGMMKAMMANMSSGMRANPQIAALFDKDPRVEPIFARFIAKVQADTEARMKAGLPTMIAAMQRAYARRFTVTQMDELTAFFSTPTGQAYFSQAQTIMSDPDVAAWQREMTAGTFTRMPEQVRSFVAEIMALKPPLKAQ